MNPDLGETERFFHRQIPLTKAMGVRVEAHDCRQLADLDTRQLRDLAREDELAGLPVRKR